MSKTNLIDAVKTAKSIHDGDYSSLRDKSFVIRGNMEKKRRSKHVKKPEGKLTLAKLAEKIDNLGNDLRNEMNTGFKQVNARIDNLENRIDKIEARLDYNGLQIEQINKRLDYNGLKQLPNKLEK